MFSSCGTANKTKTTKDSNGYSYEYVKNDPSNARIYTLANGLKVYLSVNKDKPRIQTYIAVKAGAKNDPRETTGLAHYFEHMMFKGTNKIGTLDWEKESVLISQISDLFEKYATITDPLEKKMVYAQIDSISQIAAAYAVPNEYDKVASMIGASGTNAWTSYEETVYVNEIPSNEVERWLMIERERFENLVLRLFHTELETVYEEFNMTQDNDGRKINSKMMSELFKKHPYGVNVIGIAEHLKNPSMANIMKFKDDFYVANNIAICMSGDLDMEETIKQIDKYWGDFKANDNIPKFTFEPEEPISSVKTVDIYGPERESVSIVYRTPNNKSKEIKYLDMIGSILNNGKAGIIDLDLIKKQKVMSASAYASGMNDYGIFRMNGTPRDGQTLEEVKDLLLEQIDKIKKGEFEDWLIDAIIYEMKMQRINAIDNNSMAYFFVRAFIDETSWEEFIFEAEELEKITKQEIVNFANEFFKDNYVVINKKTGVDNTATHVEKPEITPLPINRNSESEFAKQLRNIETKEIEPVFVDYKKLIKTENIAKDLEFNYIKNETTDLFNLYYIFEMGKSHNKQLPIAIDYMKYLGTEDKSIEDLQKEWYKLGVTFNISSSEKESYISISGLNENLEAAMQLVEDVIAKIKPDQDVYNEYINGIIKNRENNKLNSNVILRRGLRSYSMHGEKSSFTDIINHEELKNTNPETLTNIIKDLFNYKHKIFYYGPGTSTVVADLIKNNHNASDEYKAIPPRTEYAELDYDDPKILFTNYNMVQTMIMIISKDVKFDKELMSKIDMFNEYYGGSMGSIVFQEIRESKGLAYSSYAGYSQASESGKSNYVFGFLSTQPDKMKDALDALTGLLNEMAVSQEAFANSKDAIIKQMNTQRIIKSGIFWNYSNNLELGIDYDIRKDIYEDIKNLTIDDIEEFFNNHIKGKNYDILIVGNKDKIDFDLLKNYGRLQELSLEEVFNY
jgi:predicted Zn-dependent peptidase